MKGHNTMAHCIEHDDSVVYAGETPWHGIGEHVSADLTPEQMMTAAKLDWRVCEYRLGIQSQKPGMSEVYRGVGDGWKALVRSTDGKILDVVTKDYQTHQNQQICELARQVFDAGGMHMETAGSLEGGRVIWFLAKMDASFTLPGSVDKTSMYTLFSTGHKSGFATQLDLTAIRTVCMNTMRMARGQGGDGEKYGRFRLVHSAKFTKAHQERAVEVAAAGREALEAYRVKAERLAASKWDSDVTRAFCCELLAPMYFKQALEREIGTMTHPSLQGAMQFGYSLDYVINKTAALLGSGAIGSNGDIVKISRPATRVMELVSQQPGAEMFPGSAWNAVNAVTYYVDHERGRTRDSALNSAWFGEGANLKQSALELALAYSEMLYA